MTTTDTDTLTWKNFLEAEKENPYFKEILSFVKLERQNGKTVYPEQKNIFNALKLTPYADVKVVIIGQDPYHGPNQAHGLSFSVRPGVAIPPSLRNIYQELHDDIGFEIPDHGCLEHWAEQGVLLLNASLTVEAGKAGSHAHIGWQTFTDQVISSLNQHPEPIVFLLWGSFAQRKGQHIDRQKHCVMISPHPSPLSAHRGFFGCHHFSKANNFLRNHNRGEINWAL